MQKWKKCPIILAFITISQKSISTSDLDQILASSFQSTYVDVARGWTLFCACVLGINIQISGYLRSKKVIIIIITVTSKSRNGKTADYRMKLWWSTFVDIFTSAELFGLKILQ